MKMTAVLLTLLIFQSCKNEVVLPACNHPHKIKNGTFATNFTFEHLKDFKGYIEDIEQAQACSKATGRKIILFFTGVTMSSSSLQWLPFQNKEVKNLIDNSYVICVLFCDNPQELEPQNYFYSEIMKDTVKTIGHRNLDLSANNYQYNTQPIYVLVDEDLNQISDVIPYMGRENINLFIDVLQEHSAQEKK